MLVSNMANKVGVVGFEPAALISFSCYIYLSPVLKIRSNSMYSKEMSTFGHPIHHHSKSEKLLKTGKITP